MASPKWTQEQKAEAVRLCFSVGAKAASEATGIPAGSIKAWARLVSAVASAQGVDPLTVPVRGEPPDKFDDPVIDPDDLRWEPGSLEPVPSPDARDIAAALSRARLPALPEGEWTRRREIAVMGAIARASNAAALRAAVRQKFLEVAMDALDRVHLPHVDFVGQDADRVVYPEAPARDWLSYMRTAALGLDKYRLEVGESTDRTEVMLRQRLERLSVEIGVPVDELLRDARRIAGEAAE